MIKYDIVESLLKGKTKKDKEMKKNAPIVIIGETVYINTITYHYIGKVVKVIGNFICLEKAVWLPENENMDSFFAGNLPKKYRKIPSIMRLNAEAIICISEWPYQLP